MSSSRKIHLYILLTVISYFAMAAGFKEYLKPGARAVLYLGGAESVPFILYMPILGIVGLFTVPFIKRKRLLLVVSLLLQFAPFLFLLYSKNFNTFSNPSFSIPAFLYLIFASITTISVFQNNSISEQRIPFQR